MNKLVIANRGAGYIGKSSSVRAVYQLLKDKGHKLLVEEWQGEDIKAIFDVDGVKVGVESQGDPSSQMGETMEKYVKVGCDIIVTACRTKSDTYHIVPDYLYERKVKESITTLSRYMVNNAEAAAHGLLEIAKDLYSIKTEFSVYDKLIKGGEALSMQLFNIRNVLMTVVYPFLGDFTKKNIYVDIYPYRDSVLVDFETIQIAFYHIIENMSKYVKPNTKVVISFPKDDSSQMVLFDMISIHIAADEIEKIFTEGYSGNQAVLSGLNGEGIGLYRAKRLIELNKGSLEVEAGEDVQRYMGIDYANNRFIISLPL